MIFRISLWLEDNIADYQTCTVPFVIDLQRSYNIFLKHFQTFVMLVFFYCSSAFCMSTVPTKALTQFVSVMSPDICYNINIQF